MRRLAALLVLCVVLPCWGQAQAPEIASSDPKVEERLKDLAAELRCLVCQNQTIADSNAPLAIDLRGQIRTQISQGRSDDQIRDYMVQRYGDFVLYRPPLRASTALLWAGPVLLIAIGLGVFLRLVRRRRVAATADLAPERRAEIEQLLGKD